MILGKSDFWPHRGLRFRILRKITYEGDFSAFIRQQNQEKHRYRGDIRESTLSHGLVEIFESTKKIKIDKKFRANFFFWVCQNRQFYPFLVVIYYLRPPRWPNFSEKMFGGCWTNVFSTYWNTFSIWPFMTKVLIALQVKTVFYAWNRLPGPRRFLH